MKNVTYHLLVNLSVSDLMITCLCGPVHVIHSLVMGERGQRSLFAKLCYFWGNKTWEKKQPVQDFWVFFDIVFFTVLTFWTLFFSL